MRIQTISIANYPPIKNLKIENLSNVVIIAGANGSGKTRLKEAIIQTFQGSPQMSLEIRATKDEEKQRFNDDSINVIQGQSNQILNQYMQSRSFGRGKYVGSLVQIDSDRNITTTKYNKINYQTSDPDDQDSPSTFYCQNFANRWQDFMNYIHQKVAAYNTKLAEEVKNNQEKKGREILLKLPHPLDKYKAIFKKLLQDKELQDIDPANPGEFKYKTDEGIILPFKALSSGEQEIIKIIFDIERKDIKHSVILVDEPELHLHPTLTFKLIENLKTIGEQTNQFIFLTHSADIISTYYSTGDVYFIDAEQTGQNQAHKLSELDHSHKTLVKLIGENLGLFAVGKKLIFIEGDSSSIDRMTYHSIAQKYLPDAKVIPIGSVESIGTLNIIEEQIRNAIFGIDFYMIRDRDGLANDQINELEKSGKLKCLKRRHIENYFFDEGTLFKVAERLCLTTINPQITPTYIISELKKIASKMFNLNLLQSIKDYLVLNHNLDIPTVRNIDKKSSEEIKIEMISGVKQSLSKINIDLSEVKLDQWITTEKLKLERSLQADEWIIDFRGKEIFSVFCSNVFHDDVLKIRQAYVDIALQEKPNIFKDIIDIYQSFN
ncbi:AAA family ATPase [Candidatus Beckwithbacteria bacterium]|nr:AAA family ATPase [Candidatus Beckwithbacteria bacterium]